MPVQRDRSSLGDLRAGLYCRVSKGSAVADQAGRKSDEKSTVDQESAGRAWCAAHGVTVAAVYTDPAMSASRFAVVKERPGFNRMVADVKAGKLGILWFWDLDRQQRRLGVFADLRDLCRARDMWWVIGETIIDCTVSRELLVPAVQTLLAEEESETKSVNVRRGVASNAAQGLPFGRMPYGYRRFYRPDVPRGAHLADILDRQDPDGLLPGVKLAPGNPPSDGQLAEDSPAWIIRQMFRRFAYGEGSGPWSTRRIAWDLNERGIPVSTPPNRGRSGDKPEWRGATVANMLKNPAYVALRVHQGNVLELADGVMPSWPPLVNRETFWAVQERMSDPARDRFRTRSGSTDLLARVVRCERCRKVMGGRKEKNYRVYFCAEFGCYKTSIQQAPLDEYVQDVIIRWASDPEVYAALRARASSADAETARADVLQIRTALKEFYAAAEAGEAGSAVLAAMTEKGLLIRLGEAEQRERETTLPAVLAKFIGADAAVKWLALDIPAKREIIRTVADITLLRIGQGRYRAAGGVRFPVAERVEWRWLLGPDGGVGIP